MSYGQQQRTTESWNSDPNNFSNTGGRSGQNPQNDPNWNPQAQSYATNDPTSQAQWNQRGAGAGARGASWDQSPGTPNRQQGQGQFSNQWTAGPGDNYGNTGTQGNTSSFDTPGAGGDFGGTGAGGGQWDQDQGSNTPGTGGDYGNANQGGGAGYGGSGQGTGQSSVTERLKGNAEKIAGRVKRDPNMVSRGEARKTGGDPTGTDWNDYPQNQ